MVVIFQYLNNNLLEIIINALLIKRKRNSMYNIVT